MNCFQDLLFYINYYPYERFKEQGWEPAKFVFTEDDMVELLVGIFWRAVAYHKKLEDLEWAMKSHLYHESPGNLNSVEPSDMVKQEQDEVLGLEKQLAITMFSSSTG